MSIAEVILARVTGVRGRPPSGDAACGFSLTELLVALAILAVLAAVATPLWTGQLERARRLDATDALVRVAVLQERFFFENGRYARSAELAAAPPAGLGLGGTERGYYQLRLLEVEGGVTAGFEAQAIADPDGPQAGDEQCRVFSVDSTGRRMAESAGGENSTDACWP